MYNEKIIRLLNRNALQILVIVYFVRFLFPQGIYSFTLTALFYSFTKYLIVGATIIVGLIGAVGIIKSGRKSLSINPSHRTYLVAAILGLILYSVSFIIHDNYFHMKFDSEIWRDTKTSMNSDANALTPRQRMMEDLIENHLTGLTKTEVEFLLGAPYDSWYPENGGLSFRYIVGPERGLGADSNCLVIHFDEKDNYESYTDVPICG